jgi:glycosyltransferase involved in cell wall biosynthesis
MSLDNNPKVSIITVVYNGEKTIEDTILSVDSQDYPNREHIVIDGASTDKTLAIIHEHRSCITQVVSEPDQGIYDAMNKGISLATGGIIGILNADDIYYSPHCIRLVVDAFVAQGVDAVCGDLVYVLPDNLDKIIRYYSSSGFHPDRFAYGIMPAHPAFFVKRSCYEKWGLFKTDYMIAADFELLARFLRTCQVPYTCLPRVLVKMRTGGVSTRSFKSNWILNREIVRACKENHIRTNIFKVYSKYIFKVLQFIKRPDAVVKLQDQLK